VVFVVEVAGLSVVVVMALETAVHAGLIPAAVASQVLPSELTPHVTLMTANKHTTVRLTENMHKCLHVCAATITLETAHINR